MTRGVSPGTIQDMQNTPRELSKTSTRSRKRRSNGYGYFTSSRIMVGHNTTDHYKIGDFPYIPCPPDPEAQIAELNIQIRNLASMVQTLRSYLEHIKPTIDRVAEKEAQEKEAIRKEVEEIM